MKKFFLISLTLFGLTSVFAQNVPAATPAFVGQSATFLVSVGSGTAPFTYVWKKDGVTLAQTAATFTIPVLALTDGGTYSVTVSNSAGSITAGAQLAVSVQIIAPAGITVTVTVK